MQVCPVFAWVLQGKSDGDASCRVSRLGRYRGIGRIGDRRAFLEQGRQKVHQVQQVLGLGLLVVAGAGRIDEMPATIRKRSGDLASVRVSAARFAMDGADYTVVNARDVTDSERSRLEHAAILERAPYVDLVFGPQTLHRLPELIRARRGTGAKQ